MPLFVVFIFAAVMIGSGAMLAPAWPTRQPRIGLLAALSIGLVLGGAIFIAMIFGFNILMIDYLLFVLITVIFLGGTLSYGQKRAEDGGDELLDAEQGWPGPHDILFFVLAGLIFIVPVAVLPVPLDTDAQGFGYLALMIRMGEGFNTLAPWHPEVEYLYSPAFLLLSAYLSQQLDQSMNYIQFGIAAVLGLMNVMVAYDMGAELRDKRLGRAFALVMLLGMGLFTAFMDSHFTALMALMFGQAFITFALRYQRDGSRADAIAAGLMLGATVLSQPDTTIILGLGYVPWLFSMWLGTPRPTVKRWLVMAAGIPLIALLAISPWLWRISELLGSNIVSPFGRDPNYWQVMIVYHGVWTVIAVLIGAVVGLRQRSQAALLAAGWVLLVLDFSTLGILETLVPFLIDPVLRYDYPFSIAWHGPIIPYTILGGMGALWVWDRFIGPRFGAALRRSAYVLLGIGIAGALILGALSPQILALSKGRISFFGAFASHADVEAMTWIRKNTPEDARILNFPGTNFDNSHEGDWVPVISERDSVFFRWQPFFRGIEPIITEQDQLRVFWEDPANPAHAALLEAAGIDYVIVPQIVANPESLESAWRWNTPFAWEFTMQSTVAEAEYLEQVFDADGAQVYQVIREG
jgi:hypothetical protein